MPYKVYYGSIGRDFGDPDYEYHWESRKLMYDSSATENDNDYLMSPKLIREANAAGSFEADVPKSNSCWNDLKLILGIVEIERDGEIIWQGRITEIETSFDLTKHIYCEGELAYLNDDVVAIDWSSLTKTMTNSSGKEVTVYDIPKAFNEYCGMSMTANGKQITSKFENYEGLSSEDIELEKQALDRIMLTTSDPELSVDDIRYTTCWDFLMNTFLNGMLSNLDGCVYVFIDREKDGEYYKRYLKFMCLDWDSMSSRSIGYDNVIYGRSLRKETSQTVEFGKNLTDLKVSKTVQNLKTQAIVYGYYETGWWIFKDTKPIIGTAVNDKLAYEYGLISTISSVEGKSVYSYSELDKIGADILSSSDNGVFEEITASAIDLVDAGVDTDRLDFMKFSRIISEPHGVDTVLLCVKLEEPLDDPSNKVFTFGRKRNTNSQNQANGDAISERSYGMSKNVKSYITR